MDILAVAAGAAGGAIALTAEEGGEAAGLTINLFWVLVSAINFLILLAIVWTFAGAMSSGGSVREAFPFALLAMGSAAVMGVGIWRVTGRVPLDWKRRRFYAIHAGGLVAF